MGAHATRQTTNPAAFHEAGHCVAALLVAGGRYAPTLVTVRPDSTPDGASLRSAHGRTVLRRGRPANGTRRDLDVWAVVVAAGAVAEQAACGEANAFDDEQELEATFAARCGIARTLRALEARGADDEIAALFERTGFERRLSAWRRRIDAPARRLLGMRRARRAAARLVQALVERGTLRGAEITAAAGLGRPRAQRRSV